MRLDTGHFAGRRFDNLGLEPVLLGPAQVHPQYHLGPVLRLCTACTRLDVQVGVIGVELPGKHAPEFESLEFGLESPDVGLDFGDRVGIVFLDRHRQQLAGIAQAVSQLIEDDDDLFELGTLLPERLRTFRLVPYIGLFEFALDLGQAFSLTVIVKDTSSTHPCVQRGR